MSQEHGYYFSVEDVFEIARGVVLIGRAVSADTPWPEPGEAVQLRQPGGASRTVTILDVDKSLTRSCFSDGSANRGILIARDAVSDLPCRGTGVLSTSLPGCEITR